MTQRGQISMHFSTNQLLLWHVHSWGCFESSRDDDKTQQPHIVDVAPATTPTVTEPVRMEEASNRTNRVSSMFTNWTVNMPLQRKTSRSKSEKCKTNNISVFFWVFFCLIQQPYKVVKQDFLKLKKTVVLSSGLREMVFKASSAGIYSVKATTALKLLSTT